MVSLPLILFLVACILTLISLIQDGAKSLHLWACFLVCLGLTYHFWAGKL
jgi:hypothetical protein